MASVKNYYEIIGVAKDATEEEIKSAYRKLAKKFHPDAHPGDPECERRFREINEAYGILGDSEKRKEYDKKTAGTKSAAKPKQKRTYDNRENGSPGVDFENIHRSFANFFGFHPETKDITNEEKLNPKTANPLDTTELFERFMGIKR